MPASKRLSMLLKAALVFSAGFATALVAQTYSDSPQRVELKRADLSGAPGILPTSTTLLNLRDVKHAGFKVVGDVPLKLFTVHVVDKGRPLYDFSK